MITLTDKKKHFSKNNSKRLQILERNYVVNTMLLSDVACKKKKTQENFFDVQIAFLLRNTNMKAFFSHPVQIFRNLMTEVQKSAE